MPVIDYRYTNDSIPDQICIVISPQSQPTRDWQEHQAGAITIDSCGVVGYLPVYSDYETAVNDHPESYIHIMNLVNYKKDIGLIPPDKNI